ncbi:CPBP family intramembrane glutamic endopeptidase [Bacillus haimaensis]|uniref:CPBP family glutamic-type intramembrane protease n=1 Tax=Bacillus haimaensis TaxID=3160967 RepID=UPI003AA91F81
MKKNWFLVILGFIILSAYFQLIPILVPLDGVFWVGFALLFFVLAHFVAKLTSLDGIKSFGYRFHQGWSKNLFTGFLIGFFAWGILYGVSYMLGRFEITGFVEPTAMIWLLVQASIGMFLGSTINDAICRGYIFAHLKSSFPVWGIVIISTIIYALDDSWYEGISLHNFTFSVILGLSLSLAFAKTHSIWFTTGIHWGLNMMYSLVYGLPGSGEKGGIFILKGVKDGWIFEVLSLIVPAIMFLSLMVYFNKGDAKEKRLDI